MATSSDSHAQIEAANAALEQHVAERTEALTAINAQLQVELAERRRMEDALRESEARFRSVAQSAAEAIITADSSGRIVFWNQGAARIFGYPAEEMLGQALTRLMPERYRTAHERGMARLAATGEERVIGKTVELHGQRQDGSEFPLEFSLASWQTGTGVFYSGIIRDTTERKRAAEARAAMEAAAAANQAKSEFLSRMSHELRTPLNAILGFAQLLQMDRLTPLQDESVGLILKGGHHLLDLINEVLDIARIEQGRLTLTPAPVAVAPLLDECLALARPLAAPSSLTLHLHLPPGGPGYVLADHQRLKQVLLNLLTNAVKYNHPGGRVDVIAQASPNEVQDTRDEGRGMEGAGNADPTAASDLHLIPRPAEGSLRILLRDTGPGIPADKLDLVFTPFERLGAEHGPIEGTGLGLALSKYLVEAMGGTIGVDSQVGQGSSFWIDMPRTAPPPAAPAPDAPGAAPAARPGVQPVLYVEDNLSNQKLVEQILRWRPGIQLLTVTQGTAALAQARAAPPALILLDLQLPDLSGLEVLRRLQADPRLRLIPVVVLSADATPQQVETLLAAGARAYLTKPIDVPQFLATLDENLTG